MLDQKKCVPCQGGIPPLSTEEIKSYLLKLDEEWKVENDKKIYKCYQFKFYREAQIFVNSIADLAENEGHHPYIHFNFKNVIVFLFTHKIDGLHENDFIMAAKCDIIYSNMK